MSTLCPVADGVRMFGGSEQASGGRAAAGKGRVLVTGGGGPCVTRDSNSHASLGVLYELVS